MTEVTKRARVWPTIVVWTLHVACVATAVAFAATFVLMATSLDPLEMINAGTEPWANALIWAAGVLGIVLVSAIGLALWHSRRQRALGLVLLFVEIAGMIWAGFAIYEEYF